MCRSIITSPFFNVFLINRMVAPPLYTSDMSFRRVLLTYTSLLPVPSFVHLLFLGFSPHFFLPLRRRSDVCFCRIPLHYLSRFCCPFLKNKETTGTCNRDVYVRGARGDQSGEVFSVDFKMT